VIVSLPRPAVVETLTVQPIGDRWRVTSSDGLFEGVFTDAKSAVQSARAEVEAHPGHILVVAPPPVAA
jgi:hypothetical protein